MTAPATEDLRRELTPQVLGTLVRRLARLASIAEQRYLKVPGQPGEIISAG